MTSGSSWQRRRIIYPVTWLGMMAAVMLFTSGGTGRLHDSYRASILLPASTTMPGGITQGESDLVNSSGRSALATSEASSYVAGSGQLPDAAHAAADVLEDQAGSAPEPSHAKTKSQALEKMAAWFFRTPQSSTGGTASVSEEAQAPEVAQDVPASEVISAPVPETEPKPEPEPKSDSQPESDPRPEPQPKPEPKLEPEEKPEPKSQQDLESKTEPEPDSQTAQQLESVPKSEPKPDTDSNPEQKSESEAEPKPDHTSEHDSEPKSAPEPEPKPEPDHKSEHKSEPEHVSEHHSDPNPDTDPKPEPEAEHKPETDSKPEPEPKPEPKEDPKPDDPQPESESTSDPKPVTDSNPETASNLEPGPKPEPKEEPKPDELQAVSDSKSEPKPETDPAPERETASDAEPGPEPKSSEAKGESKGESKEEPKGKPEGEPNEEPKGEPKEEPKEELKGEPKEEPKEEPKPEPAVPAVNGELTDFDGKDIQWDAPATDGYGDQYFAMCLAVKNQHADIREWVGHHKAVGAGKIYLYDHGSEPPLDDILKDHLESGFVKYIQQPLDFGNKTHPKRPLLDIYNDCMEQFGKSHQFLGFLDSDEFLILEGGTPSVPALLRRMMAHRPIGGLVVNWRLFGSSGHHYRPEGGVLRNFNKCTAKKTKHTIHVKTIANTDQAMQAVGPHHWNYKPGFFAVNEHFKRVDGPQNEDVTTDRIVIHHYILKSLMDYMAKVVRGNAMGGRKPMGFFYEIDKEATETCTQALKLGPYD